MTALHKLLSWLEEQPARDKESLKKLARLGWFLGPHMPVAAITKLGNAVELAPDEVDMAFALYIRRHLNDIEARLTDSYPRRAHLFREAFGAHRECKYSLSIRAFLGEADGIFYDKFRNPFFVRGRKNTVSDYISGVRGHFIRAVLYPLSEDVPLWTHTHNLDDTFDGLNRHKVIHGMEVNYDTELNSLKAISLLDNLLWVLNRRE